MRAPCSPAAHLLTASIAVGSVATLLAVTECAHGPIDFGPRGRLTRPEPLLGEILARRERAKSIRGDANVTIDTRKGTASLIDLITAEAPANLRVETTSLSGSPLEVLTADGTAFALFDMEHHQFFEGSATPANVSRLLPVELHPEDVTSLLLGVPPLLPAVTAERMRVDESEGCYVLTLVNRNLEAHTEAAEAIGLEPATLRPLWVRMNATAGITAFEATLGSYDPDADLPREIKLTTREPKTSMTLRWRDRQVNLELQPESFVQAPPPGLMPTDVP